MHLIILASQATVTVRGLGLCCCVSCVSRLSIDAAFSFSLSVVSLSVEGSNVVGVRKDSLQKPFDHQGLGGLRVAGTIIP